MPLLFNSPEFGWIWYILPIIIHDCQGNADMLHAVLGNVKDKSLIVTGVQSVFLDGSLTLLQAPPFTHEGCFNIGIWKRCRQKIEKGGPGLEGKAAKPNLYQMPSLVASLSLTFCPTPFLITVILIPLSTRSLDYLIGLWQESFLKSSEWGFYSCGNCLRVLTEDKCCPL